VDVFVAKGRSGTGYVSGTSFSAPIVTALAARSGQGLGSANRLRARLKAQAQDLGKAGFDGTFGWGLVRGSGC